jgi:hypothetical protein
VSGCATANRMNNDAPGTAEPADPGAAPASTRTVNLAWRRRCPPDHGHDQAVFPELLDCLLGGDVADAVLLGDGAQARQSRDQFPADSMRRTCPPTCSPARWPPPPPSATTPPAPRPWPGWPRTCPPTCSPKPLAASGSEQTIAALLERAWSLNARGTRLPYVFLLRASLTGINRDVCLGILVAVAPAILAVGGRRQSGGAPAR